jgi:hypothetical protein
MESVVWFKKIMIIERPDLHMFTKDHDQSIYQLNSQFIFNIV